MAAPVASYDPLAGVDVLTDVGAVAFIAAQLNDKAQNQNVALGANRVSDLTDAIVDITFESTAQGASILVVTITDFQLQLITRFGNSPAFIDSDDSGLLLPVDVNFPQNTNRWWRLMAADISSDLTQANLRLTFEDRIVVELRDLAGPKTAGKGQTRAAFVQSCVTQVSDLVFWCPALHKAAGSVGGNLTLGQIQSAQAAANAATRRALNVPSATQPNAPTARRNPTKKPGSGSTAKNLGAVWTPGGWKYTKPINGISPGVMTIVNPPTNVLDSTAPSGAQQQAAAALNQGGNVGGQGHG